MKNFINISDISKTDLRFIIDNAKMRKEKRSLLSKNSTDKDAPLNGKILVMIFEKPSTRTRISFDLAVKQLGGKSVTLNPDEIHYGTGNESLHDTAKVLSQYADIVILRTYAHKKVLDFLLEVIGKSDRMSTSNSRNSNASSSDVNISVGDKDKVELDVALQQIEKLDMVSGKSNLIRVEK